MSRQRRTVLILTACFLSSMLTVTGQSNKAKEQAKQKEEGGSVLKKWPEENVPYIIDPEEEKAFKGLKTDEERENFIEQFWLRRDPWSRSQLAVVCCRKMALARLGCSVAQHSRKMA